MKKNLDTPAKRLKYFIDTKYSGRIINFEKAAGLKKDTIIKYIGDGNKSILGGKMLINFDNAKLDVYWYLTGKQIDNTQLYRGEDLISNTDVIDKVENLYIEPVRVINSNNIEKEIIHNKEMVNVF